MMRMMILALLLLLWVVVYIISFNITKFPTIHLWTKHWYSFTNETITTNSQRRWYHPIIIALAVFWQQTKSIIIATTPMTKTNRWGYPKIEKLCDRRVQYIYSIYLLSPICNECLNQPYTWNITNVTSRCRCFHFLFYQTRNERSFLSCVSVFVKYFLRWNTKRTESDLFLLLWEDLLMACTPHIICDLISCEKMFWLQMPWKSLLAGHDRARLLCFLDVGWSSNVLSLSNTLCKFPRFSAICFNQSC